MNDPKAAEFTRLLEYLRMSRGFDFTGYKRTSLMRRVSMGLQERLPDRSGDHRVLPFRHVRQGIAHPMYATSLPGGAEHPSDREAQALMGIRDHQLDAFEPALDQAF